MIKEGRQVMESLEEERDEENWNKKNKILKFK